MYQRLGHFAFATLFGAAACFVAPAALANGRFPAADQLIFDPNDPQHIVVRTTFGFIETRNTRDWLWTCEEIVGRIANQDPPFTVAGDGTLVVAVPFEGVSVSRDHGCTWSRAPAPLMGQLAVDVTLEPNDPASLVVLTSTNDTDRDAGPGAPAEFLNLVVETKDHANTWTLLGTPLSRDFIAATIEIARSDPNRIYASGVIYGDTLVPAIERTEDRGKTWTRALVPAPKGYGSVYISAVNAQNADRLFVRALGEPDAASGATPTILLASSDKGDTWSELARTAESMLGFALSPDGATLAYGTLGQGIFIGPSDGSAPFENVIKIQNRCLTWTAAGLYACGTEPLDPFAVGLSHDTGKSFETLYKLPNTCPTSCPDDSRFNQVCRMSWEMMPGVATATGAKGATCSVAWAKTAVPDAGSGGGSGGTTGGGGNGGGTGGGGSGGGGADGGTVEPGPSGGDSCSCRIAGDEGRRAPNDVSRLCFAGLALLFGLRRRAGGD